MPREQITHNQVLRKMPDVPTGAIIDVEVPRRNVHVVWHREGAWVQLAIDLTVAEIRDLLKHAEEEGAAAARAYEHIGEYATERHQVRVVSDVLNRAEVNGTITALRRARDIAYGKDA